MNLCLQEEASKKQKEIEAAEAQARERARTALQASKDDIRKSIDFRNSKEFNQAGLKSMWETKTTQVRFLSSGSG